MTTGPWPIEKKKKNKIIDRLAQNAGALVTATKDVAGDQVQEARERVDFALEHVRNLYDQVCDRALDGTTAVNAIVHKNSYQVIAIGIGFGAILGYLLARNCKNVCGTGSKGKGA